MHEGPEKIKLEQRESGRRENHNYAEHPRLIALCLD
jgi:hypothetical protein